MIGSIDTIIIETVFPGGHIIRDYRLNEHCNEVELFPYPFKLSKLHTGIFH